MEAKKNVLIGCLICCCICALGLFAPQIKLHMSTGTKELTGLELMLGFKGNTGESTGFSIVAFCQYAFLVLGAGCIAILLFDHIIGLPFFLPKNLIASFAGICFIVSCVLGIVAFATLNIDEVMYGSWATESTGFSSIFSFFPLLSGLMSIAYINIKEK